jgi:hypothetical protein
MTIQGANIMKRTKHLACAIALTFLAGLSWSAQAQNRLTTIKGIEATPGVETPERGVINGTSFLGKTSGLYPGSFFMSLNYTTQSFGFSQTQNIITIGTWSLPVYRANQYLGAVYGRVVDGTMDWNSDKTIATVNITMSVDGGTQTFEKSNGKANFVGTLDRTTRGKPTLNGSLMFAF